MSATRIPMKRTTTRNNSKLARATRAVSSTELRRSEIVTIWLTPLKGIVPDKSGSTVRK